MKDFPILFNVPESEKNEAWCKSWLDAIDDYFRSTDNINRIQKIYSNYNSYNGIINSDTIKLNQAKFGSDKAISTPLRDYFIGRTKVSTLIGEWLQQNLVANVFTTNREAVNAKLESFQQIYGTLAAQNELKQVQEKTGWDIIGGAQLPEMSENADPDSIRNTALSMLPKAANEIVMQAILNDKIRRGKLKMSLIECLKDLILTSEIHLKVEQDQDGRDTLRPFPAAYAIFAESTFDYDCSRSPFRGEYRPMFEHEILEMYDLDKKEREQLKGEAENYFINWNNINDLPTYPVLSVEIKSTRPVIVKVSEVNGKKIQRILDPVDWETNKEKINRDIENGKYKLIVKYKEDLWEGTKIGRTIYKNMRRKTNQVQIKGSGKYHRVKSDYVSCLVGTVNGRRIAIQEVIRNLSEVYNFVMWQIWREIKKNKGKVFVYDEAAMPATAKTIKNVLYDLEENNVIRINSAEEGNVSYRTLNQATQLITALDLGLSASFPQLVATKQEIERTIDRLTGISEQREGFGKATETATATETRLAGSKAVTGEIFYCFQEFINNAFLVLAEKVKMNEEYLENEGYFILGDDQRALLKNTKQLTFDEYGVFISDGRKESYVREMLRQYFPGEINAGAIRSLDIAAFELTDSITDGMRVLEKAYSVIQKANTENERIRAESQDKATQAQIQIAREDREDRQAHEIELKQMELSAKSNQHLTKIASDQIKSNEQLRVQEENQDNQFLNRV